MSCVEESKAAGTVLLLGVTSLCVLPSCRKSGASVVVLTTRGLTNATDNRVRSQMNGGVTLSFQTTTLSRRPLASLSPPSALVLQHSLPQLSALTSRSFLLYFRYGSEICVSLFVCRHLRPLHLYYITWQTILIEHRPLVIMNLSIKYDRYD